MGDVVRVELHDNFDIGLLIVFADVLHWDVKIIESEKVGADHLDPILAHRDILWVPLAHLVKLFGHLLHFLEEVLNKDSFVFLFNLAL